MVLEAVMYDCKVWWTQKFIAGKSLGAMDETLPRFCDESGNHSRTAPEQAYVSIGADSSGHTVNKF